MHFLLLAQDVTPDAAIGWAERMNKGGVPVIALVVAIACGIGMVLLFRKLLAMREDFQNLEANYRKTIEAKATADETKAEGRMREFKAETAQMQAKIDSMWAERLKSEKETDLLIAQQGRIIEANTKMLERIENKLG